MVLKILCAIVIIATAGTDRASAAKKNGKRKAKTTQVKKTRKYRKARNDHKVTEIVIVEDEREVGDICCVDIPVEVLEDYVAAVGVVHCEERSHPGQCDYAIRCH